MKRIESENKDLKETKASQTKVISLLEEHNKLLKEKLAKKEKELMLKDSENAQEFNDLFDDVKEKEEFITRLKKQRNNLEKENKELKERSEKKENDLQQLSNTGEKQKKLLKDLIEKNHDNEKDAEKHKKESTVLKKEKGD